MSATTRTVYVYNYHYAARGICRNRPLTYATLQTQGACVHKLIAGSRAEALRAALAEHVACDQADRNCERCHPRDRRAEDGQ